MAQDNNLFKLRYSKSSIIAPAVLLAIVSGNFMRTSAFANIRMVDFVSVFAMGMLAGVLLTQVLFMIKQRGQEQSK